MRTSTVFRLFIFLLLGSEFLHIEVFGGSIRIYHLITPLIVISLSGHLSKLTRTGVFWLFLGFFLANVIAAAMAPSPIDALRRLVLLAGNMSIALAIALMLLSGRIQIKDLIRVAFLVAVAGIALSGIQLIAFSFTGVNLGLSETQELQVAAGFASGFRTEANSFAKYLNVVFLLMLPTLLASANVRRSLYPAGALIVGMLLSFTRSALYGLCLTLILSYFWYLTTRRGRLISSSSLAVIAVGVLALAGFGTFVGEFNEYAAHKLGTFFSLEEASEGGSGALRLVSQELLWSAFTSTPKTIIFGNGWGEIAFEIGDQKYQAFGSEVVMALAFSGVIGGFFYVAYQLASINAARRATKVPTPSEAGQSEGVLLALLGCFITGFLSGSLIAPEYWMLYGMAMYYSARRMRTMHRTPSSAVAFRLRQ